MISFTQTRWFLLCAFACGTNAPPSTVHPPSATTGAEALESSSERSPGTLAFGSLRPSDRVRLEAAFAADGDVTVFGSYPAGTDSIWVEVVLPSEYAECNQGCGSLDESELRTCYGECEGEDDVDFEDGCIQECDAMVRELEECQESCEGLGDEPNECERTRLRVVSLQRSDEVRTMKELSSVCLARDFSNAEVADFDVDGELEIRVVSEVETYTMADSRAGAGELEGQSRVAVYLSHAFEEQAALALHTRFFDTEGGAAEDGCDANVAHEDVDGDGYADLRIQRACASYLCEADDFTSAESDDEDCDIVTVEGVRRYERASDTWGRFETL